MELSSASSDFLLCCTCSFLTSTSVMNFVGYEYQKQREPEQITLDKGEEAGEDGGDVEA